MSEKYLGNNLHSMNEPESWLDHYIPVDEMAPFAFSQIQVVDRESFAGVDVEKEMEMMLRGLEASGDLRIVETTSSADGGIESSYALHFVREDGVAHPVSHFAYAPKIGLHKKVARVYVCDKCGMEREWLQPLIGAEESFESYAHPNKRNICFGGTFHLKGEC